MADNKTKAEKPKKTEVEESESDLKLIIQKNTAQKKVMKKIIEKFNLKT
nr:hypothetical protein [Bacteroidota bacterium]